ncbi:hypothetical protein SNE35_18660 [Paucibacter sp. R3-3]|uniref:Flp pilus assembly protein CpaB n=1 Tax=Roseateles agri TaxID=3098619 RepID=A0ABU5DJS0_9BURK|nr:hypothetical protein [Paucibacter sp. R3-3]MDY0746542.1 hypothetical protein [Paucibacter sp. R3-3]
MSSNDKYFALGLVGIVAIFGSVALELAQAATPAPQEVVKLERVVIVGKRAPVVAQLPRVIIEGCRTLPADGVQVATANAPASRI